MSATGNPCPRCDRPIADTGYVCHECRRQLRQKLRTAAAHIETGRLDDVVGRQTRSGSLGVTEPRPVDRPVYSGPWCYGGGIDCGHPSCRLIWRSITHRSVEQGGRMETPIPNEAAGVLNDAAAGTRFVVANTARIWADLVHDVRGSLIPVARPRIEPRERLTAVPDGRKAKSAEPWCIWGDLPFDQCGCGRPHQEEA